jgi:hypothetical protein
MASLSRNPRSSVDKHIDQAAAIKLTPSWIGFIGWGGKASRRSEKFVQLCLARLEGLNRSNYWSRLALKFATVQNLLVHGEFMAEKGELLKPGSAAAEVALMRANGNPQVPLSDVSDQETEAVRSVSDRIPDQHIRSSAHALSVRLRWSLTAPWLSCCDEMKRRDAMDIIGWIKGLSPKSP